MKRLPFLFLLALASLVTPAASAQTGQVVGQNALATALRQMHALPELRNASLAFLALDLETGDTLAALNERLAVAPASNQKLLTTATALELLGADFRFPTYLRHDGSLDTAARLLRGNLIVLGGGDPTLGSERFSHNANFLQAWAKLLKDSGIDSISGAVVADASLYPSQNVPDTWTWGNMGNFYGASPSALCFHDNSFALVFKTSAVPGSPATLLRTEPPIPGLVLDNQVRAASIGYDNAYIYGAPNDLHRLATGEIPLGRSEFSVNGSVPDPPLLLAQRLHEALAQAGIRVAEPPTTRRAMALEGKAPGTGVHMLDTLLSPPLSEIVRVTNLISFNLYAENLLCQIGLAKKSEASTSAGAQAMLEFWAAKGMDTRGLSIEDGSGLSRYDALTAEQMVFLLRHMRLRSPNAETFLASLPIAGKTGTLSSLCRGTAAEGKIMAKSGSVRRIRAYSGYATTRSGRTIAFAMIANHFNCSDNQMRAHMEKIMVSMASLWP